MVSETQPFIILIVKNTKVPAVEGKIKRRHPGKNRKKKEKGIQNKPAKMEKQDQTGNHEEK